MLLAISRPSEVAQADTITTSNGGTLTARIDSVSPSAPSGNLCPSGRNKPNFEAWITDAKITIGSSKSTIDFNTNVQWRECDNNTEAYAIFSGKFCPKAGYYGGGTTNENGVDEYIAWDCVKYIAKVPNDQVNPSLGCAFDGKAADEKRHKNLAGHNHNCVTSLGKAQILLKEVRPASGNPSNNSQVRSLPVDREVGAVHSGTRSSGSNSLSGQICQFFWFSKIRTNPGKTPAKYRDGNAGDSDTSVCQTVTINYSWTYTPPPSYTLSAYAKNLPSPFSYVTKAPVDWGMNTDAAANLTSDGIGAHDVDLWKVVYKLGVTIPTRWQNGGGVNTITAPNPCSSFGATDSSKASCDRVEENSCPNTAKGCNKITAAGQGWGWNHAEDNTLYTVGTRVCYVARVAKPTYTSTDDKWKTSGMICATSSVMPKVQIRGHDLRAGGVTNTSLHTANSKYYGSWGEYGVLSALCNQGGRTSSGAAGLAGSGASDFSRHQLTFANIGNATGCKGEFGGLSAPNIDTYKEGTTRGDEAEAGVVEFPATLRSSEADNAAKDAIFKSSTIQPGAKRIYYYPKATVRITDNLEYPDEVSSLAKIPRIVIIAKDIVIDPGVTQIDAWLLAKKQDDGTGGRISTCRQYDTLPATLDSNFSYAVNIARLTSKGVCKEKLTFNGPVVADKIYLLRTYHDAPADTSDDEVKKLAEPAEIFNLRADAFLSSLSTSGNPVATTDKVVELPPRF